jgi:hypothetical protein
LFELLFCFKNFPAKKSEWRKPDPNFQIVSGEGHAQIKPLKTAVINGFSTILAFENPLEFLYLFL